MALLQRENLARNAEQFADEILDVRREGDDQSGEFFAGQRIGIGAGRKQAGPKRFVGCSELAEKRFVDTHQAFPVVQILETQVER